MTVDDILDALGGRKAVAAALGATRTAPYNWRRDGIPARHWHVLVQMAAERGVKGISFEALRTTGRLRPPGRERRVTVESRSVRKSGASGHLRAGRKIETQAASR